MRPDAATWKAMLDAFIKHGPSIKKVVKVTGLPRDLVAQAWNQGWPGQVGRPPKYDSDTGDLMDPGQPTIQALLPLHDIVERANMQARKARERIYKDTVDAQVQLTQEAHNDALRQRSLEALAVRTSLMLGDQAVKNALSLQLATVPVYEQLAVKLKDMADDPQRSAGAIMKVLREVSEVGRLATQQLETAMVMERKHLGAPEAHLSMSAARSADEVANEIKLLLARALVDKMTNAQAALEGRVIDVEQAFPSPTAPQGKRGDEFVWQPAEPAQDD